MGRSRKGFDVFFGAETEENVPEKCTIYTFGAEIPKGEDYSTLHEYSASAGTVRKDCEFLLTPGCLHKSTAADFAGTGTVVMIKTLVARRRPLLIYRGDGRLESRPGGAPNKGVTQVR